MKIKNAVLSLLMLASGESVNADQRGLVGNGSQGITFFKPISMFTAINVVPGGIPGTTLLLQRIDLRKDQQTCAYLVRGKVETQTDVDALKPENLIQMSCTPTRMGVDVIPPN